MMPMGEWAYAPLRDYLPPRPSIFTWSVLRGCTERAVRDGYRDAGYTWPPGVTLLRLADGEPQLNTAAWRAAVAATLGLASGAQGGLLGKLLRRPAPKAAASVADAAPERFAEIERWQARVHRVGDKWTQADILQVMEEVERLALSLWQLSWRIEIEAETARAALPQADVARLLLGLAAEGEGKARLWEMAHALPQDADGDAMRPLLDAFGHHSADDLEAAAPRWREAPPAVADMLSTLPPLQSLEAQRQQAGAGLPPAARALLPKAQALERLRGQAHAARVRLVDATRTWALACGGDAVNDGRLARREDIFLFEIEEVKQLMTGEWNKPAQVQALVQERQQAASAARST